jgi:hypothetical protein
LGGGEVVVGPGRVCILYEALSWLDV